MFGFEWVTAGNSILDDNHQFDNSESRRVPEDGADFFNPLLL